MTTDTSEAVGGGRSTLVASSPLTPSSAVVPSTIRSKVFVAPGVASKVVNGPAASIPVTGSVNPQVPPELTVITRANSAVP